MLVITPSNFAWLLKLLEIQFSSQHHVSGISHLHDFPPPHSVNVNTCPILVHPLGCAVHATDAMVKLAAYTDGYSICACSLCVLENGIFVCYTGTVWYKQY